MTQLTINIEDKSILPHLKKILNALEGVSIAKPTRTKKSGIEEAMDDVKAGRVKRFESMEELFKDLGI
ncbi:MAG: response regulator [Muribaculaceae bacterium]|nr:response regulator [Muribaculaceae bacterium]